jgi:hypothetical protein
LDRDIEKLKKWIIKQKLEGQQVDQFVFKQESVEKCSITGGTAIKQVDGKALKKNLKDDPVEQNLKNH